MYLEDAWGGRFARSLDAPATLGQVIAVNGGGWNAFLR